MPIISIKDVTKQYGAKKVLKGVSFDINQGEIFGLLGSNGAGKSTITQIILGLQKQTSGSITYFEGKQVNLKQKISLVPQDPAFYKDFSVEKNMRFFASIFGLKKNKINARVEFLLKWLELNDFKDVKASFLSGGYQRLLNIALSVIHDPEIIFLDEPTVGLDPKMRKMFWEKIKELKKAGKTIILTTHYMDEAQDLCTRIALLKKGELLITGSPQELIKKYGGLNLMIYKIENGLIDKDVEKIKEVLQNNSVMEKGELLFLPIENEHGVEKLTAITQWLINKGYNIIASTTRKPDLEDVFLNLTGEKMDIKK
jgi:ABC-2 type transport system ATP-binding protein